METRNANAEQQCSGSIDASVDIGVVIKPTSKECTASISLDITARNSSDVEIPFHKPYVLPTRFALNIKAWDDDGTLIPTYKDDKLSVPFPHRKAIPAHRSHTYHITFDRTIDVRRDGNALIVVYKIPPENSFQDAEVHSHEFNCTFKFLKPVDDTWRRLRQYRVILVDNRRVITELTHDGEGTTCKLLRFPTGPNDPETVLNFVCLYQLTPRFGPLAVEALTTILRLLLRATVGMLFRR